LRHARANLIVFHHCKLSPLCGSNNWSIWPNEVG
jgi:hypothetical protein